MNSRFIALTILALLLTGAIWWVKPYFSPRATPTPDIDSAITEQGFMITQTLVYGQNQASNSAQIPVKKGETALQALAAHHEVVTQTDGNNVEVIGINGVENGSQDKQWQLYINGETATTSANNYELQPLDDILWEFTAPLPLDL